MSAEHPAATTEQLELIPAEPATPGAPDAYDEPQPTDVYQLTQLPGTDFEDIFKGAA